MTHQRLKDFWINKINNLITKFSVDPDVLDAGADWAEKMNDMGKWLDIEHFGKSVCRDIHIKKGKALPKSFTKGENYNKILDDCFTDLELNFIDLANVCKTKIGVDPTDDTLATDADGNNIVVDGNPIPKWKHFINQKIPNGITLNNLPNKISFLGAIYRTELFRQIVDNGALEDLIEWGAIQPDGRRAYIANSHGYNFIYRVDTNKLTEYKNSKTTITNAETHLGLNPGDLATITTNPAYNTNGKTLTQLLTPHTCPPCALTHCPTAHADYNTIKGESAEYQRIHTKLSGKVSDGELDNLLNQTPNCSHTDYDTIKQERDDLKQQQANYSTEKQQAIQDKEKEIIKKIITDLGLATERERERALEAVITEIKAKLTPPICDKCPGKDSKISELQEQITKLQTPKTLKDLPISKGVKEEVIKISQELGLTTQSCAKLEKATSYQELSSLQKQAFQERLEKETSDKNSANSLNWALGILTLGSLLALAWMIMKQNKGILPELDKEEK